MMINSLRILSYNCYGLKSSLVDLYEICERFDIIFLQETLLFKHGLPVLSNIHSEFEGMGISAIDGTSKILAGRSYGGVAILIRSLLRPVCEFEFYDDTRMIGLEVKHLKERLYIINVYLPYQCPDNYDLYAEYLGKILAIGEDCHSTKIAIIGDFNAAVGTTFENELLKLCTHHKLIIADYKKCGRTSNQFTYVSDAYSAVARRGWVTL